MLVVSLGLVELQASRQQLTVGEAEPSKENAPCGAVEQKCSSSGARKILTIRYI
jgi:hypothetical protein